MWLLTQNVGFVCRKSGKSLCLFVTSGGQHAVGVGRKLLLVVPPIWFCTLSPLWLPYIKAPTSTLLSRLDTGPRQKRLFVRPQERASNSSSLFRLPVWLHTLLFSGAVRISTGNTFPAFATGLCNRVSLVLFAGGKMTFWVACLLHVLLRHNTGPFSLAGGFSAFAMDAWSSNWRPIPSECLVRRHPTTRHPSFPPSKFSPTNLSLRPTFPPACT